MRKVGLTIIIPCYNSADMILNSLKSITSNVSEIYNVEIIVIDDCSGDNTFEKVEKFSKNNTLDNVDIKILRNEYNMGAGESRNVGLEYANKEYITFLDSDDVYAKEFFSCVALTLMENNDIVVFDAVRDFGKTQQYMDMFYAPAIKGGVVNVKNALVYMNGSTCGKIYSSNLIKEHRIKFGNTPRMEDLVFSKIAVSFAKRIYYIRKPLYIYNNKSYSLTNDSSLLCSENIMRAYDEIKNKINNKNFQSELNSIYFLEVLYMAVMNQIRVGKKTKEIKKSYERYIREYDKNDEYIKGYKKQYKIAYYLFKQGLFDVIKILIYLKNKGK